MLGRERVRRRRVLLLAMLLMVGAVAATSVSASTPESPRVEVFRIDTTALSWQTDPALSYITYGWQLEYATCAKLLNYPEAPPPEGSRLVPEIAAAMPTISSDQRTYTFVIRDDYAFSPPASGVVTPQSMKWTFERVAHPSMASPGYQFMTNIVGATEYHNGQAPEISGIVASGNTLTITLIQPQGHFLALIAMPLFCAVPNGFPPVEQFAPIPSAGPYYISSHVISQSIVATRNPNYDGPRAQPWETIEYHLNQLESDVRQRVESGISDYGLAIGYWDELRQLYGPESPAAGRGLQQWFPNSTTCVGYIPLNTERDLFDDVNMRKAVNYVIDRTALSTLGGLRPLYQAPVWDQYFPPGMPGYSDISAYPSQADIAQARQLANWQPGDPLRPARLYYRTGGTINPAEGQMLHDALLEIGINAEMVGFTLGNLYTALGTRGEPFDLAISVGWCEDWHDPWNYIQLFDGTTIHDGAGNINFAYFNDPVFNDRMHAAMQLVGEARYAAFGQIEHDLVRDAAPWAAWRLYGLSEFFSRRIGCHVYQHAYQGMSLSALCLRPEIGTDDATILEPALGTEMVQVPVRLSSEMDNSVTVQYATQDGTAQAGLDYTATSGSLTFAPHERLRTVSVPVNDDLLREPSETFFLNLSSQSSGTIVDGQAVVTILDRPVGPPPPGPPPPPPPPIEPPPPPPPAPPVRCVVPRVIGMPLRRAKSRIRARRCGVGRVRYARSRRTGKVIGQTPRPGTRKPRGFKVRLVVGRR